MNASPRGGYDNTALPSASRRKAWADGPWSQSQDVISLSGTSFFYSHKLITSSPTARPGEAKRQPAPFGRAHMIRKECGPPIIPSWKLQGLVIVSAGDGCWPGRHPSGAARQGTGLSLEAQGAETPPPHSPGSQMSLNCLSERGGHHRGPGPPLTSPPGSRLPSTPLLPHQLCLCPL